MKKTIDSKTYNTETANEVASDSGGGYCNDFRYWEETLYKTKKGNYFLYGSGGPLSRYSESCGSGSANGSNIVSLSEQEALEWCEEHECEEAIAEYFPHLIQEA